MYTIGIVGAGSLVAKELADELQDSLLAASDFILLDDEEITGKVASIGDEAAFIQKIDQGSFDRMDFVFFAGNAASTRKHFEAARKSGASLVDLTYQLEQENGVVLRAPWVQIGDRNTAAPNLGTPAVVAAHPAAVMLALVASRIHKLLPIQSFAATMVEPASQQGREAMDELHQQTVNLLSFQNLPKDQFDAQVAFNILPSLGDAAKVNLLAMEELISRHYSRIGVGALPLLDLDLVQAPVFHGYVASVLVELQSPSTVKQLQETMAGESIKIINDASDPPSNLSAAGQGEIMVRVKSARAGGTRFWLWLAADNLKLSALNAIACANELRRLRPRGKIQ